MQFLVGPVRFFSWNIWYRTQNETTLEGPGMPISHQDQGQLTAGGLEGHAGPEAPGDMLT